MEDGEEAEATETISKEEAAERLLVGSVSPDTRLMPTDCSTEVCVLVAVVGDGEDHRRAERDVGRETEEDRIYSAGEVTPLLCFVILHLVRTVITEVVIFVIFIFILFITAYNNSVMC